MRLFNLDLLKNRRHRVTRRVRIDPTANWTPRDWADLPVHHPRAEDDSR